MRLNSKDTRAMCFSCEEDYESQLSALAKTIEGHAERIGTLHKALEAIEARNESRFSSKPEDMTIERMRVIAREALKAVRS